MLHDAIKLIFHFALAFSISLCVSKQALSDDGGLEGQEIMEECAEWYLDEIDNYCAKNLTRCIVCAVVHPSSPSLQERELTCRGWLARCISAASRLADLCYLIPGFSDLRAKSRDYPAIPYCTDR